MQVKQFKSQIKGTFEARDLGPVEFYNGSKIRRDATGSLHMSQPAYSKSILTAAGMEDAKVVSIPMNPGCHL